MARRWQVWSTRRHPGLEGIIASTASRLDKAAGKEALTEPNLAIIRRHGCHGMAGKSAMAASRGRRGRRGFPARASIRSRAKVDESEISGRIRKLRQGPVHGQSTGPELVSRSNPPRAGVRPCSRRPRRLWSDDEHIDGVWSTFGTTRSTCAHRRSRVERRRRWRRCSWARSSTRRSPRSSGTCKL